MKNYEQKFVVVEIEGQFLVVDRQKWEQDHPTALLSVVGSSRLAAGPFLTKEEAEQALEHLTA